ncbi:MAG: type II toxin-antitoxin system HicA family toxin [Dehalococcoidia bacterium]
MPHFGPISASDLIRALRRAGFDGPFPGARHRVMRRGDLVLRVPNEHGRDISTGLLARILREAGMGRDEWERL